VDFEVKAADKPPESQAVLHSAVEQVQQMALDYNHTKFALPADQWLALLKIGLDMASHDAEELLPANFEPREIRRQRRKIRRQIAKEDLGAALGLDEEQ
jgi:hypothetical protein